MSMRHPKRIWSENFYVHNDVVVDPPMDIKEGVVELQLQEAGERICVLIESVKEIPNGTAKEIHGCFLDATVWYTFYFFVWLAPENGVCRIRFSPNCMMPYSEREKQYGKLIEENIETYNQNIKLDIPLEEKHKIVDKLQKRIDEYRGNRSLLYEDLRNMVKVSELDSGRGKFCSDGCYDSEAEGYDLNARTPVEQSIRLLCLYGEIDPNVCGVLEYQKIFRIGDFLSAAWTGDILKLHMGSNECEKCLESVEKLGIPVDWIIDRWRYSEHCQ